MPAIANALYGSFLVPATLLAGQDHETAAQTIVLLAGVGLGLFLAEAYAQSVAMRVEAGRPLPWRTYFERVDEDVWLLLPFGVAIVPYILALAGIMKVDTAENIDLLLEVCLIFFIGLIVFGARQRHWLVAVGAATVSAGLGLGVVALKLYVH